MTLHLVLVLAAFTSTIEDREQVRAVEERLCQFPPAEVIETFRAISQEHFCWLQEAGAAIPSHRREAYAAHLADAEHLYDAWECLYCANDALNEAKRLANGANGGRTDIILSKWPFTVEFELAKAGKAIKALETVLSEEDFRAGRMPPPLPYWRFQWID